MPSITRPVAFAVLMSLSGCAWITQNQAARAEYARQVEVASLRAADLEDQVASLETKVTEIEATVALHGQNETQRLETIEEVNSEIVKLRGQIEELQFHVAAIQKTLDQDAIARERRFLHAEKRLTALEKYLHVPTPPPPTDAEMGLATAAGTGAPTDGTTPPTDGSTGTTGTTGTDAATPAVEPPRNADEAIDQAVANMKEGRQGIARVILQKALTDWPKSPEEPEILYRIGETYLNESDWKAAAKQFDLVVRSYPKSSWAPWSMLRQGEAFQGLGKADTARLFWQGVIDQYPKSEAAAEAKKRLAGG